MRTLTIFLISLFSLPLALNAQSVDEMLQKVSAAIEAGQNGQAVSYFRQTIPLNIDRTEMYYWTNVDKNSEISSKLAIKRNGITTKLICSTKSCCKRTQIM